MKFVTHKGSDTFNKLTALRVRIDECRRAAHAVVRELGFEEYATYDDNLGTGIAAFRSKNGQPNGFKKTKDWGWYKPRANNKAVCEKIKSVPKVEAAELNEIIGFNGFQVIGLRVITRPSVWWNDNFCLIGFPDEVQYTPRPDMTELLASQFLEYQAIVKREEEKAEQEQQRNDTE